MNRVHDEDEVPLFLAKRVRRRPILDDVAPDAASRTAQVLALEEGDRLGPAKAGAVVGAFAGGAAYGAVHALQPSILPASIALVGKASLAMGFVAPPPDIALGFVYAVAAVGGVVVGACFARITRHLRRFLPLLIWSLVFFMSLAMLVQAGVNAYGYAAQALSLQALFGASAAFAVVVSFALPLRRRWRVGPH